MTARISIPEPLPVTDVQILRLPDDLLIFNTDRTLSPMSSSNHNRFTFPLSPLQWTDTRVILRSVGLGFVMGHGSERDQKVMSDMGSRMHEDEIVETLQWSSRTETNILAGGVNKADAIASESCHGEVICYAPQFMQDVEIHGYSQTVLKRQRAMSDVIEERPLGGHYRERWFHFRGHGHHTAGAGGSLTGTGFDDYRGGTALNGTEGTAGGLAQMSYQRRWITGHDHGKTSCFKAKTYAGGLRQWHRIDDKRVSTLQRAVKKEEVRKTLQKTKPDTYNKQQNKRHKPWQGIMLDRVKRKSLCGDTRPIMPKLAITPMMVSVIQKGHRDGSEDTLTCFECGALGTLHKGSVQMRKTKATVGNQARETIGYSALVYVVGKMGCKSRHVVAASTGTYRLAPPFRNEGLSEQHERAIRQRLYKDQFLAPGELRSLSLTQASPFKITIIVKVNLVAMWIHYRIAYCIDDKFMSIVFLFPIRLKKKYVKRLVEKRVAKAIEEYEKSRPNLDSAGSSGGNTRNNGGTVNKVEQVFEICKCTEEDKVMFAASTFEGRALTWWNGNVHTLGLVNANRIPWTEFKMMITMEYCQAIEIQRMEQELWTQTLKGDDIEAYNNRFHELALICPELVPTEKKKIEKYVRGFPERIKGNITSSKPVTMHDAINMAREQVEQALQGGIASGLDAAPAKVEVMLESTKVHVDFTHGPALLSVIMTVLLWEKGTLQDRCPKGKEPPKRESWSDYVVVDKPAAESECGHGACTTLTDYVQVPEHDDDEIADPEEDGDEDPEEDPIDYPADGGDDGDDEIDIEEDEDDDMDIEADEEDEDDEMDVEIDEEEEEEHLAPAYPVVVALPATAHLQRRLSRLRLMSLRPHHHHHPAYGWRLGFPISIHYLYPAWSDSETSAHLLANISPTSIPTTIIPLTVIERADPGYLTTRMGLGYRIGVLGLRLERLRRCCARTSGGYVRYGITDSLEEMLRQGAPVSTDTELGAHMREFESLVRRDTDEIYTRLDDEQGQRQLLAGRVNMLFRDRRTHAHTRQLMETEAGMSREAWGRAMDASDLAHGGVISLRTTVHAQMAEIAELQSADRRRQRAMSDLLETDRRRREEMRELRAADRTRQQQIIQTLTAVQTLQRETIPLQGLVTTLQEQVTALQGQVMTLQGQVTALQGQQGPAGGPAPPELPEEAGSSS
ncbi:putative reverse transcriptase domain-containing protein [Tanacetum coccineum]